MCDEKIKQIKRELLEEILKTYQTAIHEDRPDKTYLEGCEHTMSRVIVDIQQRYFKLL